MTPESIKALVDASVQASLLAVLWPLLVPGIGGLLGLGGVLWQGRATAKKAEAVELALQTAARNADVEANATKIGLLQRELDSRPHRNEVYETISRHSERLTALEMTGATLIEGRRNTDDRLARIEAKLDQLLASKP